jgi:hypothetical protein
MNTNLTLIVRSEGIEILKDPDQACQQLQSRMDPDSSYPYQIKLLLETTEIGKAVQNADNFHELGSAAYQAFLMRAVKQTGFTVDVVRSLVNDILDAAGIRIDAIYLTQLQESERIREILDEDGISIRGEDAYRRAVLLLTGNHGGNEIKKTDADDAKQKTALKLLERAALDGCHKAYGLLAICYYYGIGTIIDYQEAWRCIRMPEALENNYEKQLMAIYESLYEMQADIRKKRWMTILLAASVVVFTLLINISVGAHLAGIALFLLAGVHLAACIYELLVRHGNLKFAQYSVMTSLVLWFLMIVWGTAV